MWSGAADYVGGVLQAHVDEVGTSGHRVAASKAHVVVVDVCLYS
jgi:hypothetical protein